MSAVALSAPVQIETVLQAKLNQKEDVAIASATSGDVSVESEDKLKAPHGDGIIATSSAVAVADLDQRATQTNDNSATATGGVVVQGQLVGQANVNAGLLDDEAGQAGVAIADA